MMNTTYIGTPPPEGILLAENDDWQLYFRKHCGNGWVNLKLISKTPQPNKGNYWLGYQQYKRLSRNRDEVILAAHHPELLAWINEKLLNQDFVGWPAELAPV